MKFVETNGVILLCQGDHSIQLSAQEVQDMRGMGINDLRIFLRSRRIPIKSQTNESLRVIESNVMEIPNAIQAYFSDNDDDGVLIEPAG